MHRGSVAFGTAGDEHVARGEAEQVLRGIADVLFLGLMRAETAYDQKRRRLFLKVFIDFVVGLSCQEPAFHVDAFSVPQTDRVIQMTLVYLAKTVIDYLVMQL